LALMLANDALIRSIIVLFFIHPPIKLYYDFFYLKLQAK
jgi:hypothetical protein